MYQEIFRKSRKSQIVNLSFSLLVLMLAGVAGILSASAQAPANKIGVNLEGPFGGGGRSRTWVNVVRGADPAYVIGQYGVNAPQDANLYPLTDFEIYFFNEQIVAEWRGNIDDPDRFRLDISGVYKLSFRGQATLSAAGNVTITNQRYDAASNTTTADVNVPAGSAFVLITFRDTRRTAQSPVNSGVTDYKLIRPGYDVNTTQIFTNEFLASLRPFNTLRFLGWDDTNNSNPDYPDVTGWNDRHLPTDATQGRVGKKIGVAWEYIIQLCNEANKDMWINIPVSATDDYIRQLALLIRNGNQFTAGLKPALKIYLEHSNEVWIDAFTQRAYNRSAAQAEVAAGNSLLNNDGTTDAEELGRRRHARRTRDIVQIFAGVFGQNEINGRLRGVYAHQHTENAQIERVLTWASRTYGAPNGYFYAVSTAPYFTWFNAFNGTVPQILQSFRDQAADTATANRELARIARSFNLRVTAYEGGTITVDGQDQGVAVPGIANGIRAERDPQMRDIVKAAIKDHWLDVGGDVMELYCYFTLAGPYNRYGCYGATEDVRNLNTPKYLALAELANSTGGPVNQPPVVSLLSPQSGATFIAPANILLRAAATDDRQQIGTVDFLANGQKVGSSQNTLNEFSWQNVPAGTYTLTASATDADGATGTSAPVTITVTGPTQAGNGLRGEYFSNISLSGAPKLTRTDATVNFDWKRNEPASGLPKDNFSVRWSGQVLAPTTGDYTFVTITDDGTRLFVNGQQIINRWVDQPATRVASSAIRLEGGKRYDIRLEYYERLYDAVAQLRWIAPGGPEQIIPQAQLFASATSSTQTISLQPGCDRDDWAPNPGESPFLNSSQWQTMFLKFPAAAGVNGDIVSAKLRLYRPNTQQGTITLTPAGITSDDWCDGSTYVGQIIGPSAPDLKVTSSASGWVEIDVTPLARPNVRGNINLAIRGSGNGWQPFHSRENATNKPELVITFVPRS